MMDPLVKNTKEGTFEKTYILSMFERTTYHQSTIWYIAVSAF